MRKVNGLSLVFIEFYVPALTRLNMTETSLHFSVKIILFEVCHIYTGVISKETWIYTRCLGVYIYAVLCWGQERTLWNPCLYIP
jgi:hypothetical protein